MLQQTLPLSLILLSSLIFSMSLLVSIAESHVYVQCSQLSFTSDTPYESNVNSLFTSLIKSASVYNFNKFQTSSQNDDVYGLFQCRGDVTSPNCKDCVANAVSQLQTACQMSTGGQIQLEGCFIKYDDTAFFGAQEKTEVSKRCGPTTGYNLDVSNRIDGALAYLVGGNGQYFREGDFGNIECVAQCVQDLSLSDCQDCLSEASGRLRSECETSISGDMYFGKCYIRYANQGSEILVVNNGTSSSHNGHLEYIPTWMSGIAASLTFIGTVLGCGTCFAKRKEIKKVLIDIRMGNVEKKVEKNVEKKMENKGEKNVEKKVEKKIDEEIQQVKRPAEGGEKKRESQLYVPPITMTPPCPYYAETYMNHPSASYYSTYSYPNACYYPTDSSPYGCLIM